MDIIRKVKSESTRFAKQLYREMRIFLIRHHLPTPLSAAGFLAQQLLTDGRAMVNATRLETLRRQCLMKSNQPGAFVECGVAKGGCLALMAYMAGPGRSVWGFDSFEGMPPLSIKDEGHGQEWVGVSCAGEEGEAAVTKTFAMFGISMKSVHLCKGWFENTLPIARQKIGKIVILRLDNDWYESTLFCLDQLYDQVVPGGVIIIDDYHTFKGCRKAVDEFRQARGITVSIITTHERSEAYWVKSDLPSL